jgi:hypothetical protein
MPGFIDKIRDLFGGGSSAAPGSASPEDLSRHPDDDDPGATTGLDRPFPDAPPPPPD